MYRLGYYTKKGLKAVVLLSENPEHVQSAKQELLRRGYKKVADHSRRGQHLPQERELDGYEKDI